MSNVQFLLGNCIDVLTTFPDNSVDSVVTDPPYGIEFMGNEWDGADGFRRSINPADVGRKNVFGRVSRTSPEYKTGIIFQEFCEKWATECLRVLKPGGYLLAFGGARTYHRMACAVEDAGFEIRDQIAEFFESGRDVQSFFESLDAEQRSALVKLLEEAADPLLGQLFWTYGQGMPKSLAVDKAIDKQGSNRDSDAFIPFSKHYAAQRVAAGYTHAQVCELGHFYSNVNHGGLSVNWETGLSLPTVAQWDIVAPILKLDEKWKALVAREEHEREVVGTRKVHKGLAFTSEGKEFLDVTTPATPASAAWAGWGTALKPSHEPIVVARKPFPGTVASNVLKYGTGAINIDGCRVEHVTVADGNPALNPHLRTHINGGNGGHIFPTETERRVVTPNQGGRWPANIVHDGSDEVVNAFPEAKGQQGDLKETGRARPSKGRFGDMAAPVAHAARVDSSISAARFFNACRDGEATANKRYTAEGATSFSMLPGQRRFDSGSVARFFYCAKPTSKERHMGLEDPGPQFEHGDTLRKIENKLKKGNTHPTVKPVALMRWLQRLVTPPGGVTLDPFVGSGSSAMAAAQEGFHFIGIDGDAQWVDIQVKRTRAAAPDAIITPAVDPFDAMDDALVEESAKIIPEDIPA